MRNLCTKLSCKGKMKGTAQSVFNSEEDGIHEGIKTVRLMVGDEKDNPTPKCDCSTTSHLCICIVTWNMNGQVCYEDIEKLVDKERRNFDLLVIGLQEVRRNSHISKLLERALSHTHTYPVRESHYAISPSICYGPQRLEFFIREVEIDKHAVGGCGGLIGRKKGAVAVKINYKGILIDFISCHLSAHAHKVEERNAQCRHISHSLFSKNWNPNARPAQITVWLGDLNYRLEGINTFPARNIINKNLHTMLTSKDQLLQEAERGQIFNGYCEGTLSFKPTYKYNIGTNNYDTSYKVRVPSWTDRILFKIENADEIHADLHSYESIDSINSSDHKPVKAQLCIKIDKSQ